jgi:octaprenyl-diphosphate synthase
LKGNCTIRGTAAGRPIAPRPGDLEQAIHLVERRGALAETLSRARSYAATAIGALSIFRAGIERRALIDAAAFATERGF